MSEVSESRPLDKRPFLWTLAILGMIVLVVLGFQYAGNQRLHNTALWQHFRPVTLVSPPQTATPVEVIDTRRVSQSVVQTERGLYFLTGARHVPEAGSRVVVQTNERWDLYLCAADGSRCMSIHSFCADMRWNEFARDESGKAEGCFAPRALDTPPPEPFEIKTPPPVAGVMGRRARPRPPAGITHPREWAWRMGLPVPAR